MPPQLIITARAFKDIETARNWYDNQSLLAGDWFIEEINLYVTNIANNPWRYAMVTTGVRRCLLKKFPYKIFFSAKSHVVVILRIRHNKQKPLKRYS